MKKRKKSKKGYYSGTILPYKLFNKIIKRPSISHETILFIAQRRSLDGFDCEKDYTVFPVT
jgi:hypothetical protein